MRDKIVIEMSDKMILKMGVVLDELCWAVGMCIEGGKSYHRNMNSRQDSR